MWSLQVWILWDLLLHGEIEMWWYTLLKGVAWSSRHWHSTAFDILLPLYSIYFITYPLCYIQILREIRAKLPVFNDLWGWKRKTTRILISTHKTCLVLVTSWLVPTLCGMFLGLEQAFLCADVSANLQRRCRAQNLHMEKVACSKPRLSLGKTWLDFEYGSLANCRSKTFCSLLQWLMARMSLNKNVDIELESFLLDPNSSEGMKVLGKGRKNVNIFNWK